MPSYAIEYQLLAEKVLEGMRSLDFPTGEDFLSTQSAEHEEALDEEASTLKPRLDAHVLHWIQNGVFPNMPLRQQRFLYYRFVAASDFLQQLCLPEEPSVFRVAAMRETGFLSWLLCHWASHFYLRTGIDLHRQALTARKKFHL